MVLRDRPTVLCRRRLGLDAISFDGVDDRLIRDLNDPGGISGPTVNDKSRSMFLVARFHDSSTLGGATYGRGALNQAFGIGVGGPGANQGDIAVQVWPDSGDFYFQSEGYTSPGNSTGWMVLSVVHERDGFNPADNNWIYRDGVEIASWDHKLNTKLQRHARPQRQHCVAHGAGRRHQRAWTRRNGRGLRGWSTTMRCRTPIAPRSKAT